MVVTDLGDLIEFLIVEALAEHLKSVHKNNGFSVLVTELLDLIYVQLEFVSIKQVKVPYLNVVSLGKPLVELRAWSWR